MTDYVNPNAINPILNKKFEDLGGGNKLRGFYIWSKGFDSALHDLQRMRLSSMGEAIQQELKKSHPEDTFRTADIRMWLRANADDFIDTLGTFQRALKNTDTLKDVVAVPLDKE